MFTCMSCCTPFSDDWEPSEDDVDLCDDCKPLCRMCGVNETSEDSAYCDDC